MARGTVKWFNPTMIPGAAHGQPQFMNYGHFIDANAEAQVR